MIKENNLKDELKTPYQIKEKEIVLSVKLINKAIHEFHKLNSKLFSLQDLKKSIKNSEIPTGQRTARVFNDVCKCIFIDKKVTN
jgi:hypothetical protein